MSEKTRILFYRIASYMLVCGISVMAGIIIAGIDNFGITAEIQHRPQQRVNTAAERATPEAAKAEHPNPFVEVAEKVSPSVVQITTTRIEVVRRMDPFQEFDRFFEGPFGDYFREFFGPRQQEPREERRRREGLGSGVILTEDGYIATNYHVIKDVDEIQVKLLKKDRLFDAEVVGVDEHTDIAVIKINPEKPLIPATLGDSDKLRIGEWAIAIGNPFGLEETVTVGVISATGRTGFPGLPRYQDFIQTDASINLGNSGGALVNIKGEVVGINTFIMSPYIAQGLGFAIPINMVRDIYEKLLEHGYVKRGYLGIYPQNVTPLMARRWNLPDARGVVVASVEPDSPASRAGLEVQDVIIEFNGRAIENEEQFRRVVADTPPGKEVTIRIIRGGESKSLKAALGELPTEHRHEKEEEEKAELGFEVSEITSAMAERFNLKDESGIIITEVRGGTTAEGVLRRGDIIKQVNGRAVANMDDFRAATAGIEQGDEILLLIKRGEQTFFIEIQAG